MKNIFIIISLVFTVNLVYSQDLIVTSESDSINCVITKIKKDYIYFTFKHKDEIRNTLLPLSNIKNYQHDYFETGEVSKEKIIGYKKNYKQYRFSINLGYSYLTSKISDDVPSDFRNYVKDLKSGFNIGGDATYYFAEQMGFGLKYSLYKTSNSIDNIYLEDTNGNRRYGKMSDNINISFIAPTFSTRFLNHDKSNALIMSLALGYINYYDKAVKVENLKITGDTFGMSYEIGYDIELSEKMSLGLQVSLLSSYLSKIKVDDGIETRTIKLEKENYENISRIDFSIGLRF